MVSRMKVVAWKRKMLSLLERDREETPLTPQTREPADMAEQKDVPLTARLPPKTHSLLRIACAADGKSLNEGLIAAIEAWVAAREDYKQIVALAEKSPPKK
jgi:hypothetical protein